MGRYDGEDYSDEHYLRKDLGKAREQIETLQGRMNRPVARDVISMCDAVDAWRAEGRRLMAKYSVSQGDFGIEYSDNDPLGSALAYLEAALDYSRSRGEELSGRLEVLAQRDAIG